VQCGGRRNACFALGHEWLRATKIERERRRKKKRKEIVMAR
jgi:hypothetical protein